MKTLMAVIVTVMLSGCAADGSFQMPSFWIEDKVSGQLIGCVPNPETNTKNQPCKILNLYHLP